LARPLSRRPPGQGVTIYSSWAQLPKKVGAGDRGRRETRRVAAQPPIARQSAKAAGTRWGRNARWA